MTQPGKHEPIEKGNSSGDQRSDRPADHEKVQDAAQARSLDEARQGKEELVGGDRRKMARLKALEPSGCYGLFGNMFRKNPSLQLELEKLNREKKHGPSARKNAEGGSLAFRRLPGLETFEPGQEESGPASRHDGSKAEFRVRLLEQLKENPIVGEPGKDPARDAVIPQESVAGEQEMTAGNGRTITFLDGEPVKIVHPSGETWTRNQNLKDTWHIDQPDAASGGRMLHYDMQACLKVDGEGSIEWTLIAGKDAGHVRKIDAAGVYSDQAPEGSATGTKADESRAEPKATSSKRRKQSGERQTSAKDTGGKKTGDKRVTRSPGRKKSAGIPSGKEQSGSSDSGTGPRAKQRPQPRMSEAESSLSDRGEADRARAKEAEIGEALIGQAAEPPVLDLDPRPETPPWVPIPKPIARNQIVTDIPLAKPLAPDPRTLPEPPRPVSIDRLLKQFDARQAPLPRPMPLPLPVSVGSEPHPVSFQHPSGSGPDRSRPSPADLLPRRLAPEPEALPVLVREIHFPAKAAPEPPLRKIETYPAAPQPVTIEPKAPSAPPELQPASTATDDSDLIPQPTRARGGNIEMVPVVPSYGDHKRQAGPDHPAGLSAGAPDGVSPAETAGVRDTSRQVEQSRPGPPLKPGALPAHPGEIVLKPLTAQAARQSNLAAVCRSPQGLVAQKPTLAPIPATADERAATSQASKFVIPANQASASFSIGAEHRDRLVQPPIQGGTDYSKHYDEQIARLQGQLQNNRLAASAREEAFEGNLDWDGWHRSVGEAIHNRWSGNTAAFQSDPLYREGGLHARFSFVVTRDGHVTATLTRSSGNSAYDQHCARALQAAARRFPEGSQRQRVAYKDYDFNLEPHARRGTTTPRGDREHFIVTGVRNR